MVQKFKLFNSFKPLRWQVKFRTRNMRPPNSGRMLVMIVLNIIYNNNNNNNNNKK